MLFEEFINPRTSYRPCPFWSWNDALDIEELRWQVREFADKGFGGYFMHSRVGLATQYLSSEWMNCIRACLEEGEKLGLESWLYDEDKWPSGFAGGLVPAKSDNYRVRSLIVKEIGGDEASEVLKDPWVLGIFEVTFSSPTVMKEFKRVQGVDRTKGDAHFLLFKVEMGERSNWYNGESYVDLLNPEVTEEFLRVTLDAYAKEFRKNFGEFMPGIFTDEPNYVGRNLVPWTEDMAKYFSSLNGYDILEKLPLLYFEGEGFHKVRYDFWRAVTNRFIEAFTRPYSERCAALGLKMTGHYLAEDNFAMQTRAIGAAMPHYEYMQVPGVDHLGRNIDNPLTLKQCSSVAHQFGRTRVLSELFGCSGHSMTFEDQKWIADFHLALGITFFCPHLTLYTMKGETKRDFPPTFSYHQPYWQHFRYLNDYLARASYLCSRGKFYAYILLLHSISSAWATFSPTTEDRGSQAMKYSDALLKIQDDLLALHRDFDLGDELILSRHARVEGGELVVNESRYKIVMVPPSLTWSTNTVNLLTRFLDADGKVVFVGEPPSLIDGEPAETRWREILSHSNTISVSISRGSIAEALESMLPRSISVTDDEGNEIEDILIHHRVDGVYHIYFLANKSRVRKYDAVIKFAQMGEVTEWNMTDGSVSPISTIIQGDKIILKATFYPAGSRAFVVHTSKHPTPEGRRPQTELEEKIMELPDGWRFSRLHPNSMVLDTCQYSFGDGKWSEKTPIWKARRECWKASGLEKYAGIQPWVLITKHIKPSKSFEVKIRTTFKSEVVGKRVFLVIERAPMWRLSVNGKTVSTNVKEWQWDKQFGKIDISDYVKIGENSVEISCRYASDIPIEDMYLVGDFGVKKLSDTEYAITEEPEVLRNGDWVEQGYPFYTGTMRYKARFHMEKRPEAGERILIRFPDAKGTLFLISLNNREPALVAWQPLETDITDRVQMGENELTIDVVSSLRNTFGPLHSKFGDPYWVGPKTFVDEANWTDSYQLVPYGLIKGAQIVIRRETPKR